MKSFEVENGMSGMGRDVILRICRLLWHENDEITAIVGMCEKHHSWKVHSYFTNSRPVKIPRTLSSSNWNGSFVVGHTLDACPRLLRAMPGIDLDGKIPVGIFCWTVRVKNSEELQCSFHIGMISPNPLCFIGGEGEYSACYLRLFRTHTGFCDTCVRGGRGSEAASHKETPVEDGSLVAVEIDTVARTLSFLINRKKIPFGISDIHKPYTLGVVSSERGLFASVSFHKLPSAHPCRPPCAFFDQIYTHD